MRKIYIQMFALLILSLIAACSDNDYKASVTELRLVLVKPTNVYPGEIATILGRNFSVIPEENLVFINDQQATVLEASKDELKIILPKIAPGKYSIHVKSPSGELTGLEINYLKEPDQEYIVQTIVGQTDIAKMVDGKGTEATTKLPTGIAFAPDGSLWFTDRGHNYIRRISPDFLVTSLLNVAIDGKSAIWQGGFDSRGNYYFVDKAKGLLRKVEANTMTLSTVASGLKSPMNVIFDDDDNMYVSARDNKAIYKFTPAGVKTSFATLAASPIYIVFDKYKNMIVGTSNSFVLIQISPDGTQKTIAGDGVKGKEYYDGKPGDPLHAKVGVTFGIAAGSDGCLYISDNTYNCIRKLTPDANGDYSKGTLETIVGSGMAGSNDGKGLKATFDHPYEIIITQDCKTMYVADAINFLIRRITIK